MRLSHRRIHMDVVATNLAVQIRGVLEDGRVRVALRYLLVCVCVCDACGVDAERSDTRAAAGIDLA